MTEALAIPPDWLSPELPEVQAFETDRFGMRVNTSGTRWRLNDPAMPRIISWDLFPIGGEIRHGCMLGIQDSIHSHSASTTSCVFTAISWALRNILPASSDLASLNLDWWRKYRSKSREIQREEHMHLVRAWYLWMADLGFPGIDEEDAFEVEGWKIPGGVRGEAVMRRDVDCGPLNDLQFAALIQAVRRDQPITAARAAVMLCVDLGSNPRNLVLLEERDLRVHTDNKTQLTVYLLAVPRIKKRLDQRATKLRKISPETGRVLQAVIDQNRARFGQEPDPRRPIFCRPKPTKIAYDDPAMKRFEYHWNTHTFSNAVTSFCEKAELRIPGPGDQRFRVFPRRLRYTFGTRLAIEGAPQKVIAEALDHSDLQHTMVYIEAAGKFAEKLSSALGPLLKPIYDRFLGRLVDGPADAVPANDPSKAIPAVLRGKLMGNIGTCGSGTMCALVPPLSCYLCDHFQPWRISDHEGLLKSVKELRVFMEKGMATPFSLEVVDQIIAAISSVVALKNAAGKEPTP